MQVPKTVPTLFFALSLLAACRAPMQPVRPEGDPTVQLHTPSGDELGVSTDYGVVFLGRGKQSGSVDFTVWFSSGPDTEMGVIEPLGGGLYTTTAEILLPSVPVSFMQPAAGSRVNIRGRGPQGSYSFHARTAVDERIEGILLQMDDQLAQMGDDQLGAGVYIIDEGVVSLLGLITGKVRLRDSGGWSEYVTVVGPTELWRLVTHLRNQDRPRRWVHREDIEIGS